MWSFITASYADRHNTCTTVLKPVNRTVNARRPAVENMGIGNCSLDVAVTQEFLHRSNIVATFEQVSREGMPKSVASSPLR